MDKMHPARSSRSLLLRRRQMLAGALGTAISAPALAQERWPTRPIVVVAPFSPGGNVDITARLLAPLLSRALGQPVVVENRAGGAGMIGANAVARSAPDGHTLMLGTSGTNATVPAVNRTVPYHPVNDFTILGGITTTPSLLVLFPGIAADNFGELLKLAAGRADGVNIGLPGVGSFNHLVLELVRRRSGLKATHIPYKGGGQAIGDVVSGQLDGLLDQATSSMPFVRDGRIKVIAQLSKTRSAVLPDVPTLAEQGVDGIDTPVYTALFAPANLPRSIQNRLASALTVAKQDRAVRERFRLLGSEMNDLPQADFQEYAVQEFARWSDVVNTYRIQVS